MLIGAKVLSFLDEHLRQSCKQSDPSNKQEIKDPRLTAGLSGSANDKAGELRWIV
jgi:hypothetical protein